MLKGVYRMKRGKRKVIDVCVYVCIYISIYIDIDIDVYMYLSICERESTG
jgi:hypothetical protein